MSDLYAHLRDRLTAIVVDGRGADGSLGAEAQARSIPAGRFRRASQNLPLRDPNYPGGAFDRAVRVDWLAESDDTPNNPVNHPHFYVARVSVSHGVLYGPALAGATALASGESASVAVADYQERALSDARRIRRALACNALIRDAADTVSCPIGCFRDGETTLDDLGGGRLVVSSGLVFRYRLDNSDAGDP